jgi:hypothetical protein
MAERIAELRATTGYAERNAGIYADIAHLVPFATTAPQRT